MALTTKRLKWLKWLFPGEAGLQSEQSWHIDKRRNHMKDEHSAGVVSGLEVIETSPTPDLEVHVQVGRGIGGDGEEILLSSIVDVDLSSYASGGATVKIVAEYAELGTDPYIVPETSTSQDKFLQDDPTITVIIGAPAANQIVLAQVVVSNGATQITDAANPANPGTNEIDFRDRVESNVRARGFRLVNDLPAGAELSTVTVGKSDCDFDDLGDALTFVGWLTRSSSRQIAVLVFGKESGESWDITSAITIPSWTHVIGIGKPTLETSVTTGDAITLSEGSSFENVCVENTATGWSNLIASSSDDVAIRGVDVRYEHASVNSGYALAIKDGDRVRIEDFRLFPNAATPTNGCRGINFGQTGSVQHAVVNNCYLYGDQELLLTSGANLHYNQFSNIRMFATSTTAARALGLIQGTSNSMTNIFGQLESAGASKGLQVVGGALGQTATLSNIKIRSVSSDDSILLDLSNVELCGFHVIQGRVIAAASQLMGGSIYYPYSDSNPALRLSNDLLVVGIRVDRGGISTPGIGPGSVGNDDNVISACEVVNTGTAASIEGVGGGDPSDDWYVSNCIVDVATSPNGGSNWVYGATFTSHEKVI